MLRKCFPRNLCRLCGLEKAQGIDVGSSAAKRSGLLLKINKRLSKEGVHIGVGDGLPKFVCTDCELIINDFADFCKMVQEVQKRLENEKLSFEEITHKNRASPQIGHSFKNQRKINGIGCSVSENDATVSVGPDGKVECKLCQSYLEAVEHTTLHMVTHGIGTVICCCRICGHQGELAQFLRSINGREEKNSVWCEKCRFQQKSKSKSNSEEKNKQITKQRIHHCEICSKVFSSRAHLNRHQIIHSGAKPYLCEVCGTGFSQKSSLKLHILSHAGLNPHKCDQCGQSFRFKASLRSHIMTLHWPANTTTAVNAESMYRCDRCGKQFLTAYKLSRHYRSHTGERPYECDQCGRLFSQRCNLNLHKKKHEENQCLVENKQISSSYEPLVNKTHISDSLLPKAPEQFNGSLLNQPTNNIPQASTQYVTESGGVLENSHDPKFLETILQHPVVSCANLEVPETPLSTIDTVLLHSSEKDTEHDPEFVSLASEFGANTAHLTPEYLTIASEEDGKTMQEKSPTSLFTHFSHNSLLYMDQASDLRDSSASDNVALPTFSSLQSASSVSLTNMSH